MTSAADIVWEHWRDGRRMAALPEPVRPRTRAEGYAVQAALAGRSAHPLFGWKIAATSVAGQRHINVDGPLAGRLFRERVFEPGAEVPFGANSMRVAEAEFAFRMAVDLPPRREAYTVDEVLDASPPYTRRSRFPTRATTISRWWAPRSSSRTTRARTISCSVRRRQPTGGGWTWSSIR